MARPAFLHLPLNLRGHRPIQPIKNQDQANWPFHHVFRLRIYYDGLAGGEFTVGNTITGPAPGVPTAVIREITELTSTTGYLDVDTVVGSFADNDHFTDGTVNANVNGTPEIAEWLCQFPKPVNFFMLQVRGSGETGLDITVNPYEAQGPTGEEATYGPFPKTIFGGDVYNIDGYVFVNLLFNNASQDDEVEVWGFIKPENGGSYTF
jgi:hypothetical protein